MLPAAEEDALALPMEIERGAEVDRERQPLRKVRRASGHVHEPALGLDEQVESRGRGELARPDARGEDDAVGVDPPAPGLDADHAAALDDDPLHRAGLLDPGPEPDCVSRAALDDEVGRDEAGNGIEDGTAEIVDRELGHELPCLVPRQNPRLDPGRGLVYEVGLEALEIAGVVEEEEVAVKAEVEPLAHLFLEPLQPLYRFEPDPDVQLVRKQRPDTAGAAAGRTGGERFALEKERSRTAELGEIAERSRAHHAPADHDHVRSLAHAPIIAYT